jgi:hypothetical protein
VSTPERLVSPPVQPWQPANEVEQHLLTAVLAGDLAGLMGWIALAPLYLPGVEDQSAGGRHLFTADRDGVPHVLAFTSVQTLHRALQRDGWRVTTLPELVRSWPDLTGGACGLVINAGTPAAVVIPPDEVGQLLPAADARFAPANETERQLRDALGAPDGALLRDVLAASRVWVPVRALHAGGEWVVPVFTAPHRCAEFLAALGVTVDVRELYLIEALARWPGPEHRLAVNPGSSIGFSLAGSLVPGLLAHAMGLAQRLRDEG